MNDPVSESMQVGILFYSLLVLPRYHAITASIDTMKSYKAS